ncbi:MAG: RnfH family protein [Neisseriaceae bacterium]|nr:RnfH family protein [Neisseriaceae bacterium]
MSNRPKITVEVCYALPRKQVLVKLDVSPDTTAEEVVVLANLDSHFPDGTFPSPPWMLGVFAKEVKADTILRAGDRVEVYRPLLADPKEVRRLRAEAGKVMSKGGGEA